MGRHGKEDMQWCSMALRTFRITHMRLKIASDGGQDEEALGDARLFERLYEQHLRRCSEIRRRELRLKLPEAVVAFSQEQRQASRPWVGGRAKIGIIIAVSP